MTFKKLTLVAIIILLTSLSWRSLACDASEISTKLFTPEFIELWKALKNDRINPLSEKDAAVRFREKYAQLQQNTRSAKERYEHLLEIYKQQYIDLAWRIARNAGMTPESPAGIDRYESIYSDICLNPITVKVDGDDPCFKAFISLLNAKKEYDIYVMIHEKISPMPSPWGQATEHDLSQIQLGEIRLLLHEAITKKIIDETTSDILFCIYESMNKYFEVEFSYITNINTIKTKNEGKKIRDTIYNISQSSGLCDPDNIESCRNLTEAMKNLIAMKLSSIKMLFTIYQTYTVSYATKSEIERCRQEIDNLSNSSEHLPLAADIIMRLSWHIGDSWGKSEAR